MSNLRDRLQDGETSGSGINYSCSHSETSGFDRICTTSGQTRTEHWASKSDFIDEAAVLGISKLASIQVGTSASGRVIYEYDAQGRVLRITTAGTISQTNVEWDEFGRPLRMVLGGSCAGDEMTMSYGDRTLTSDIPSGLCKMHSVVTVDDDWLPLTQEDDGKLTYTYTTMSRATVCR